MLTEFFRMNRVNKKAQSLKYLYRDFTQHFVWTPTKRNWTGKSKQKVIGRLVTVKPSEGDKYYLRLLLSRVRAPTSFDDLLTVNGCKLNSFREAALELGLLESDSYIEATLEEAASFQMPSSLRFLFATLLLHCVPANLSLLWEKFELELSRDFERAQEQSHCSAAEIKRKHDKGSGQRKEYRGVTRRSLNSFKTVFSSKGQSIFIDGPGKGTGKTFLYRSLLATLRSQGYIAIDVATLGVAASLLPGGRTAHSRFKVPLDFSKNKTCQLRKQSSMAQLIIECKLFLWDEASMAKRESIEAFEELLKDLMETDESFGGKVVVFGGDFRQTLPVIQGAAKDQLIQASLLHSSLWSRMHKIKLTQNMRAVLDPAFSQFLLAIGEGAEPADVDNQICLPSHMVISFYNPKDSFDRLIAYTFPDLNLYSSNPHEMISRCILTPKNTSVEDINEMMI
ncbi:uncharacterized protein [Coffea arabica]|uniref:ATP-dependent DNA helicase n=1 Tax=Coffea arabica TaxID=13443 RepID=A0ABM4W2V3_COFAR